MATSYRKLAELADRNARTDVVYEPRIPVVVQRQQHQALEQPQQQQQPQTEGQITPKSNREDG